MALAEYLKHYARAECIELSTLIRNGDGSMKSTIIKLLTRHSADKQAVARWEKKCSAEMSERFARLMGEVKALDQAVSPLVTPTKINKV